MGAAESTATTNGTNLEEERKQESGGCSMERLKKVGAVASIVVVGLGAAALAISKMHSDNIRSQENENYLANSSSNSQSGYEYRHVSYPINRALSSPCPYKMNTDGSCRPKKRPAGYIRSNPDDTVMKGPSGFGGILRDGRGKWDRGFIGFIDISDCLTSEIHGIYYGLLLLDKLGHKGSILESDCEAAIHWITEESKCPPPSNNVINNCWNTIIDCKRLVDENQIDIRWCPREANECADKLASMAIKIRKPFAVFMEVPYEIKHIVDQESMTMCQN